MRDELDRLAELVVFRDVAETRRLLTALVEAGAEPGVAAALDGLRTLVERLGGAPAPEAWIEVEAAVAGLQALIEGDVPREPDPDLLAGFVVEAREHLAAAEAQLLTLEADPADAEALRTVFRAFHTIKGAASCIGLASMEKLAHATEDFLDLARRGERAVTPSAMDVVLEAIDLLKRLASGVEAGAPDGDPAMDELLGRLRRLSESADEAPSGPSPLPASSAAPESSAPVKESLRVDAERLDRLVDLIGELVIAESMVTRTGDRAFAQLDKITRELHETGMSLRMMPVRPLFQKLARAARDLSRKLGKPVELEMSGEEIEIDKAVASNVADALMHVVRNALDHGLEASPADRLQAGKPASGSLRLRAFHREGSLVLDVEDDGRGLDPEAIRATAVERGLLQDGEAPSEADLFKLVFLPGFSTAKAVTEVSGRGVGLDVVRCSVEALRGRVELRSRRGEGTTVRLRLPLTLAIIDGMVVRVGGERFVVPTLSVTRLVRPAPGDIATVFERGAMLALEGDLIPVLRLESLLGVPAAEAAPVAVLVEESGLRAALLVDEVLGQQQIVIKGLGVNLEKVPGISGSVILPDGRVGLILDVSGLLARRRMPEPAAGGRA